MGPKLHELADARIGVAATAGSVAELVGTACDATGYSRARFVFSFGNGAATTGALSAGIGVWESATSGGTYTSRASAALAAVSSGVLSGASKIMIVDVPVSTAKPWLKVSGGSNLSTAVPHSCVIELYDADTYDPDVLDNSTQEIVTI